MPSITAHSDALLLLLQVSPTVATTGYGADWSIWSGDIPLADEEEHSANHTRSFMRSRPEPAS